jgi:imidazolonepropionase-like amidohydrolase
VLVAQDFIDPEGTLREMQALERAGLTSVEILRGATLHPAEWLGVGDRFGTLEPGKTADILIVDGDPFERLENIGAAWRVVYDGVIQARP